MKGLSKYLRQRGMQIDGVRAILQCKLHQYSKPKTRRSPSYHLTLIGAVEEVTMVDLRDLFATPNVTNRTNRKAKATQQVRFSIDDADKKYRGRSGARMTKKGNSYSMEESGSWSQPLLDDIPEGARILSVVASSCRRNHGITFANGTNDAGEEKAPLEIGLSRTETRIGERWKRLGSVLGVYVQENSVPAAAVCTNGATEVFACCANALEVKGGGIRVDTLTLLPPGRSFVLLAFLAFGMAPFEFDGDDDELVDQSLQWLRSWIDGAEAAGIVAENDIDYEDMIDRIESAHAFHSSSWYMGEALVCHPERVRALLDIFSGVDPYLTNNEWEGLYNDPFVPNEGRSNTKYEASSPARANGNGNTEARSGKKNRRLRTPKSASRSRSRDSNEENQDGANGSPRRRPSDGRKNQAQNPQSSTSKRKQRRRKEPSDGFVNPDIRVLKEDQVQSLKRLFAQGLGAGEAELTAADLPSTNILSMVVKGFCEFIIEHNLMPEDRTFMEQAGKEGFNVDDWEIFSFETEGKSGRDVWYFADYVSSVVPFLPVEPRCSNKKGNRLPKWIKKSFVRPHAPTDVMACVPPDFSNMIESKVFPLRLPTTGKHGQVVAFSSLETAVKMGAAYWMERQFADGKRHWYQVPMDQMMDKVTQSAQL